MPSISIVPTSSSQRSTRFFAGSGPPTPRVDRAHLTESGAPAQDELRAPRQHPRAVLPAPRVTLMEGFESAYRRHFPAVLRFARSLVGRRDVAEDLTADAFVELHR